MMEGEEDKTTLHLVLKTEMGKNRNPVIGRH